MVCTQGNVQALVIDPELGHRLYNAFQARSPAALKHRLGVPGSRRLTIAAALDVSEFEKVYAYYPLDEQDDLYEEYGEPYDKRLASQAWEQAKLPVKAWIAAIDKVLQLEQDVAVAAFGKEFGEIEADLRALRAAVQGWDGADLVNDLDPADL